MRNAHNLLQSSVQSRAPFAPSRQRLRMGAVAVGVAMGLGCAHHMRVETLVRSSAVGAGGPTVAEVAVSDGRDSQDLRLAVRTPVATRLHYDVSCARTRQEGVVGETLETYQKRRRAELEAERAEKARWVGALVGSVFKPIAARATTEGPGGTATVSASINPGGIAEAAARDSLPAVVLDASDTGASSSSIRVSLADAGDERCRVTLTPEPAEQSTRGVEMSLAVIRTVDVDREQQERLATLTAEENRRDQTLRVALIANLCRVGADPEARMRVRREVEEERQAREDAVRMRRNAESARQSAERDRQSAERAERDRIDRETGLRLRFDILAFLRGHGADPDFRRRADERAMREFEEQVRLEHQETTWALSIRSETQARLRLLLPPPRPPTEAAVAIALPSIDFPPPPVAVAVSLPVVVVSQELPPPAPPPSSLPIPPPLSLPPPPVPPVVVISPTSPPAISIDVVILPPCAGPYCLSTPRGAQPRPYERPAEVGPIRSRTRPSRESGVIGFAR